MGYNMYDEPLLTITMPVYNVEKYVGRAIESILRNKFTDYELIIVDDGSTDLSGGICDELANKDPRVKVIHKKNGGLVSARETALKEAKGKYITFVDSDDYIEENAYVDALNFMITNDLDICITGHKDESENGEIYSKYEFLKAQIMSKECAIAELFLDRFYGWGLWDKIFKREVLENITIDKSIVCGEDLIRNWYAFRNAEKIGFYPLYAYHYVKHRKSMTRSCFSSNTDTIMRVFQEIKLCLDELNDEIKNAVTIGWLNRYLGVYAMMLIYTESTYTDELKMRSKVIMRNICVILKSKYITKIKKMMAIFFCLPLPMQHVMKPLLKMGYERK